MASHGYLNGQPHFSNNLLIVLLFYTFDPNQYLYTYFNIEVLRNVISEIMVFATIGIFLRTYLRMHSNPIKYHI